MTIQVTRGSAVAGNIAEADTFCFQLQAGGGGRRLEAASSITASDLRLETSASDVKKESN